MDFPIHKIQTTTEYVYAKAQEQICASLDGREELRTDAFHRVYSIDGHTSGIRLVNSLFVLPTTIFPGSIFCSIDTPKTYTIYHPCLPTISLQGFNELSKLHVSNFELPPCVRREGLTLHIAISLKYHRNLYLSVVATLFVISDDLRLGVSHPLA